MNLNGLGVVVTVVAEVVVEAVFDLRLFADISSVTVVAEAVVEAAIKAVVTSRSKAVRYCCLDSPISRWISLNETFHLPLSSALLTR